MSPMVWPEEFDHFEDNIDIDDADYDVINDDDFDDDGMCEGDVEIDDRCTTCDTKYSNCDCQSCEESD